MSALAAAACGETRRPIGDECLRDDDCLSAVCAARSCAPAPVRVTGAGGPPLDEGPRLSDAADVDAATEGG